MDSNGVTIQMPQPPNPLVVLLEQALQAVKSGHITSVALVLVPQQGGCAPHFIGGQLGDMHFGCELIQSGIIDMIKAQGKKPSIIRASAFGG